MTLPNSKLDEMLSTPFDSIEDALAALARGEIIIVADDEDRENEGDFICAADKVTPDAINFMAQHGRGLICLALPPAACDRLDLVKMVSNNTDPLKTDFTVSIDAHPKYGVTTGISAQDRAKTIQVAVAPDSTPGDLRRPGHIFPLRAKPGGVLSRVGHTEAAVDMARLAGLTPGGVICEILNPDGTMARRDELEVLAKAHRIRYVTVAQLIAYRMQKERTVIREAEAALPTMYGGFRVYAYRNTLDDAEHLALVYGDLHDIQHWQGHDGKAPLVRVHSECLTGDVLGSLRCDCGPQLHAAMEKIAAHGKGAVVYMRTHEGRGIGLVNKIKAYALQEGGLDTVEANLKMGFSADLRQYGVGAQILRDLGFTEFHLLTNNPRKLRGLDGYGLKILSQESLQMPPNANNQHYLDTKRDKLGHLLPQEN